MSQILRLGPVFLLCVLLQACVIIPIQFPTPPDVRQVTYDEGSGLMPPKIAIVDVSGVLTMDKSSGGFLESDSPVVSLARKLESVKDDGRIKAVILRIDSPGGGVTASDIMHREIMRFKEETGLPVYSSFQTMAASGGYYVAMATDEIYAAPTTITGSIGVIAVFPELTGLMEMVGVDVNAIKSGPNKDSGAFYREMGEEERALYQSLIQDFYGRFVDLVQQNRQNLEREQILELADGRVFTAHQAQAAGLIDGVAYLDEVIEIVAEKEDLKKPAVVILTKTGHREADSLYLTRAPAGDQEGATIDLRIEPGAMKSSAPEAFNYLWIP